MTGKGDSWGRDSVGRSAPAFLSANIFALPPPTCTARGQLRRRQLLFAAKPANCGPFVLRPVPGGESAGCVRLQYLFSRLCLPACHFACHAHCPHQHLAPIQQFAFPVQFILLLAPCSCPCAPGSSCRFVQIFASCETVPLAAATRACSGGPCTGPFIFDLPFSLQSP